MDAIHEEPAEGRRHVTAAAQVAATDVRASDAEREKVAGIIQQAAAEGRLTPTETDERLAALYAVRYRGEFAELTRDLPEPAPAVPPAPARPDLVERPWFSPALALHAVLVVVLAVGLISRWAVSPVPFFWPMWPILWLSISLLVHARIRRSGRPPWMWGPRWQQRPGWDQQRSRR